MNRKVRLGGDEHNSEEESQWKSRRDDGTKQHKETAAINQKGHWCSRQQEEEHRSEDNKKM